MSSLVKSTSEIALDSALTAGVHLAAVKIVDKADVFNSAGLMSIGLPSAVAEASAELLSDYVIPWVAGQDADIASRVATKMYLRPLLSGALYWGIQKYYQKSDSREMLTQILYQAGSSAAAVYVSVPLKYKLGWTDDIIAQAHSQ